MGKKIEVREKKITVSVVGTATLICRRFCRTPEERREIDNDWRKTLYYHPDGGYAFPSFGFKIAAVGAIKNMKIKKMVARSGFFIKDEFVKIKGKPTRRERYLNICIGPSGKPVQLISGQFKKWSAEFEVVYNELVISAKEILELFDMGGFMNGVGGYRAERDGKYGTFMLK